MLRTTARWLCTSSDRKLQVAIVGSGPSGCYVSDYILKKMTNVHVDIYEKIPVPFGLVRYGVAPDHPEVKNVEKKFTEMFKSNRCTLLTNIHVGKEITIDQLLQNYRAVIIAAGAGEDKKTNLPNDQLRNIIPARRFVEYYNTLPHPFGAPMSCPLELKTAERALIIGNGNVALDVARALGANYRHFCKTDMNAFACKSLMESSIKEINVVARRGAEHSAFTIKEFRELTKLPQVRVLADSFDCEKAIAAAGDTRANRRRLELVHNHCGDLSAPVLDGEDTRSVFFRYNLKPAEFLPNPRDKRAVGGVAFDVMPSDTALPLPAEGERRPERVIIPADVVLTSIGYTSAPFRGAPFDRETGTIPHDGAGRVAGHSRLYCSGWIKNGAKGVILSSLSDANETASAIVKDLTETPAIPEEESSNRGKFGLLEYMSEHEVIPFSINSVEKVWKQEREKGIDLGKAAEKVAMVQDMKDIMLGGRMARRAADRFRGKAGHRPKGLEIIEEWLDEDTELVNPAGMLEWKR